MSDRPRRELPTPIQRILYACFKWGLLVFLTAAYRYRAFGRKNVPPGGCLLVANHQSFLDPPIVGCAIPRRRFHPMARATLFSNRLFGFLIANLNAIPVRQEAGFDRRALTECINRARKGGITLIFPEGSRSPDGRIQPFQPGAGLVPRKAGCPVVPVAIDGAFEAWPRSRRLPRLFSGPIRVAYGEPIPPERFERISSREAVEVMEREVRRLHARLLERRAPADR